MNALPQNWGKNFSRKANHGAGKGWPISVLQFNILLEAMASEIRTEKKRKSVQIRNEK